MTLSEKNLIDLRKELYGDIEMVPIFVTQTSYSVHCFEFFKLTIEVVNKLFCNNILTPSKLNNMVINLNKIYNEMDEIDVVVTDLFRSYLIDILSYHMGKASEYELFETSANIKNFIEKLK